MKRLGRAMLMCLSLTCGCGSPSGSAPDRGMVRQPPSSSDQRVIPDVGTNQLPGKGRDLISRNDALNIAKKELANEGIEPQKGAPVTVELEGDVYIVTFGNVPPPGVEAGDFIRRYRIDARTGKVVLREVSA